MKIIAIIFAAALLAGCASPKSSDLAGPGVYRFNPATGEYDPTSAAAVKKSTAKARWLDEPGWVRVWPNWPHGSPTWVNLQTGETVP